MVKPGTPLKVGLILVCASTAAFGDGFRLIPMVRTTPEGGEVTNQILQLEEHQFAMKFPEGWALQIVSSNQALLMLEPDLRAGIQFRLWPQEGQGPEELETWLRRLKERKEGGSVVHLFSARSATAEGWGFDFVRAVDERTQAGLRVILVPYPGGMAEFELRAPLSEIGKYYRVLRHLVGSFSLQEKAKSVGETAPRKPPPK